MVAKIISVVSGTALLALAATASAGPMTVSSSQILTPPAPTVQVHHMGYSCHRGWHRGWRYGWNRGWSPRRDYGYGYGYPSYGYGSAAGLATLPASENYSGNYCATPEKTCLLYEPGVLGTGCSCKVPGGHARGTVQ